MQDSGGSWFSQASERMLAMLCATVVLTAFVVMNPMMPGARTSRSRILVSQGAELNLPRIPWEGGSAYYSQFANTNASGWDEPTFFPISAFLQSAAPADVADLEAAGINTYIAVQHDPETHPISNITSQGMFAIANFDPGHRAEDWTSAEVGSDTGVVGWLVTDECEMGFSNCLDHILTSAQCVTAFDTSAPSTEMYLNLAECQEIAAKNAAACDPLDTDEYQNLDECLEITYQTHVADQARDKNDGRMVVSNFGAGTGRTFWSPNQMDTHYNLMDFSAEDRYCYTSLGSGDGLDGGGFNDGSFDWPQGVEPVGSACYGFMAQQFQRFTNPASRKPIGVMVETGKPLISDCVNAPPNCRITQDQQAGAVWSAIRHEARHISYFPFDDQAGGGCGVIVGCATVAGWLATLNGRITSLAPVLNTQSYYNDSYSNNGTTFYRYTFNNGTDTMLKTYNGYAYIFAGLYFDLTGQTATCATIDDKPACKNTGTAHTTGSKTFTLPAGVNGTSVEVVGESRSISVSGGQFSDTFSNEYSNHIYKISLS